VTTLKFLSGIFLGVVLTLGTLTLAAQEEALRHPRIAKAIDAIQDARAYLLQAPPVFGGHRDAAIKACDEAIKQLREALAYEREHHR
jgi:hypothetical protein